MKRIFTLIIFLSLAITLNAQQPIQYTISFENAVHHEANVTAYFSNLNTTEPLTVRMSRSSPGRYATHEFGKNIYDIKAYNTDGAEIVINQIDGDVYEVPKHQNSVKIVYTLFGNWVDGTYAGIDSKHAHLNIPATFLWSPQHQNEAIAVKFILPAYWKIATQLKEENGFYTAPNLQYFMDSPTELSNYNLKTWEVANKDGLKQQINIVYHGKAETETLNNIESKVKLIVKEAQGVFGELPKFDNGKYQFLIDVLATNGGDGMEHRNSTIITNRGDNLEKSGERILGTVAHEFFHAWNVERIRPKTIEPFNFEKSNMSDGLWFAEGFTQYYGNLLLTRAKIKTELEFVKTQGAYLNSVLNSPGANKYSPIFMSQRAVFVDAGVAIDQNNNNNIYSSYYIYGDVTALALDLTLRGQFGKSLDGYMKLLWEKHGKTEKAYQIADLEKALAEYTLSADFANQFFAKYIYGSDKADYKSLLAKAGYVLQRTKPNTAWIGDESLSEEEGKMMITSAAIIGSPLYLAGLESGDAILKINDISINSEASLQEVLKAPIGTSYALTFERNGETLNANIKLQSNPNIEVVSFEEVGQPVTPEIVEFRKNWLNSKAIN
jgi:predicted metalloprotease with PDZ domain